MSNEFRVRIWAVFGPDIGPNGQDIAVFTQKSHAKDALDSYRLNNTMRGHGPEEIVIYSQVDLIRWSYRISMPWRYLK